MHRAPVVPLSAALLAVVAFAGCSKPEPPDKDRPPEPTAASTATATAGRPVEKHDDLLRYMQAPIEKAKTTEQTVMDAAQAQRAAVEAQEQGNAPSAPPAEQPPAY